MNTGTLSHSSVPTQHTTQYGNRFSQLSFMLVVRERENYTIIHTYTIMHVLLTISKKINMTSCVSSTDFSLVALNFHLLQFVLLCCVMFCFLVSAENCMG